MKTFREHDGRCFVTKDGAIHRPKIYVMDKSCGWQWQRLKKNATGSGGHWSMVIGRIVFTTL